MLIKKDYILITPNENICFRGIVELIDIYKEYKITKEICEHNKMWIRCEHEYCEPKKVKINDYEVWDKEKLKMILDCDYDEREVEIEHFLKDNKIKYCFELKIKEEK